MPVFESYVVVDWSASSVAKSGRDSIWSGTRDHNGIDVRNHRTRASFEDWCVGFLADRSGPVLLGFDFSLGYPAGFASALGLSDESPWAATWASLARLVEDHVDNRNNRFAVAGLLNHRAGPGPGPFWGCPPGAATASLSTKKAPGFPNKGVAEYRTTELVMRAAGHRVFSSWQLLGVGSVGSQSLMGIPVLERLRHRVGIAGQLEVWPLTTGLRLPEIGRPTVVVVEVWPSWIPLDPARHAVRDAAQVRGLVDHLAELDRDERLAPLFEPDVPVGQRAVVEAEEGWILGAGSRNPIDSSGGGSSSFGGGSPDRSGSGLGSSLHPDGSPPGSGY